MANDSFEEMDEITFLLSVFQDEVSILNNLMLNNERLPEIYILVFNSTCIPVLLLFHSKPKTYGAP